MLGADDTDGIRSFGRVDDAITLHYKVIIYDKISDVKSWTGSQGPWRSAIGTPNPAGVAEQFDCE
jgi:hypothetical protein